MLKFLTLVSPVMVVWREATMQVSWIIIIIKKLEVRRRINVFCEQIPKETVNLSTCAVLTVPPWGWSSSVSSVPTVGNSVALTDSAGLAEQ